MLFTYNGFWKSFVFVIASWSLYVVFGFEFTIVSLLSIMCINQVLNNDK